MKKLLIIVVLCGLQGACASYDYESVAAAPLLSFSELSAEISVTRTVIEDASDDEPALEDVVAALP